MLLDVDPRALIVVNFDMKNGFLIKSLSTLRRSIIVPGGLITSTGVVLVVLVLVFVVPGAVF